MESWSTSEFDRLTPTFHSDSESARLFRVASSIFETLSKYYFILTSEPFLSQSFISHWVPFSSPLFSIKPRSKVVSGNVHPFFLNDVE